MTDRLKLLTLTKTVLNLMLGIVILAVILAAIYRWQPLVILSTTTKYIIFPIQILGLLGAAVMILFIKRKTIDEINTLSIDDTQTEEDNA